MRAHLDTDFLVYALSVAGTERRRLDELAESDAEIQMSAVAWYELARGPRTPEQLAVARSFFFEDGIVFLPEEAEMGLRIQDRDVSRHFRNVHGDLLTTEYWEAVQHDLLAGLVPSISVYPDERRLLRQISRLGTYY